jgi:hypothetical protein
MARTQREQDAFWINILFNKRHSEGRIDKRYENQYLESLRIYLDSARRKREAHENPDHIKKDVENIIERTADAILYIRKAYDAETADYYVGALRDLCTKLRQRYPMPLSINDYELEYEQAIIRTAGLESFL